MAGSERRTASVTWAITGAVSSTHGAWPYYCWPGHWHAGPSCCQHACCCHHEKRPPADTWEQDAAGGEGPEAGAS